MFSREVLKIINKLNVDSRDLRGIGIQLTRLENSTVNEGGLLKFLNKSNNTSSDKKNTKLSPTDEFLSVPSTSKSEFPFHKTNGQNLAMATCSESLHDLNISQVTIYFCSLVFYRRHEWLSFTIHPSSLKLYSK